MNAATEFFGENFLGDLCKCLVLLKKHMVPAPYGDFTKSFSVEFGLILHLGFDFVRKYVEEHVPEHTMGTRELLTITVIEGDPPINVSEHFGLLRALPICPQALCACVINEFAVANVFQMELHPHPESIVGLVASSTKLDSIRVHVLGQPVHEHLLELNGQLASVLIERSKSFIGQAGQARLLLCHCKPLKDMAPVRMYFCHVVNHPL